MKKRSASSVIVTLFIVFIFIQDNHKKITEQCTDVLGIRELIVQSSSDELTR